MALWRRGGQNRGVAPARGELVRSSKQLPDQSNISGMPKYFPVLQILLDRFIFVQVLIFNMSVGGGL